LDVYVYLGGSVGGKILPHDIEYGYIAADGKTVTFNGGATLNGQFTISSVYAVEFICWNLV
jgi:hypothetical protein